MTERMNGKFYFENKDELLAEVLNAWPVVENLSLKEAFMMKILSYGELRDVERRLSSH